MTTELPEPVLPEPVLPEPMPPEPVPPSPELAHPEPFELPKEIRAAAVVVLVQSAALAVAVVVLVVEISRGGYADAARAWSDAAFALLGALILLFAARGLSYRRPAFRMPLLVLEVLTLPVGYSLIQAGRWAYGGPVVLSAVVVIGLLLTRPARVALDRADRADRADGR